MLNRAEINLKNLIYNAKEIKKRLPKGVKFCAVVKANAYGHGAEVVSNELYKYVDCFAVAIVEEGMALRLSGIDKEILVFTPPNVSDIRCAVKHKLTLTAESLKDIKIIEKIAKELAVSVTIHLKYDTGMGRYGVKTLEELTKILEYLKTSKRVKLSGFYSHFAYPEGEKERNDAVNKFLLAKRLVKSYNNKVTFHISASGGFLKGEYFDMVRIGILLYGYKPFKDDSFVVKPVMKVFSPVLNKGVIKNGGYALYGKGSIKADTPTVLVRFGYADGVERKNSKSIFNNRCMDVSLYRGKCCKKLFPIMENADKLAKEYETISYEILTKISLRAEKIYKK